MSHRRVREAAATASLLAALVVLAACASGTGGTASSSASSSGSATPDGTPSSTSSAAPTPTATRAALPTDCRAMLTAPVLAQLEGIPLNDPVFGASGVQGDGTLICVWADPAADTTSLTTTISHVSRGPALDQLNALADQEGFTCYTPDGGTRCEKTWQNETYPVTDGRTLFWRDDIMIDTRYSNLAPSGYTAAIVEHIFG